ncbi:hypothetical protein [Rhodoferax sp.]|uniref:hypothetical protein n=1 Tax=Rhodoferax sp. TaxID=50421 RepID=UPI002748CCF5|nr:hypothetical protein [Rhodoferax sp.]
MLPDPDDPMFQLTGRAVVEWSRVEQAWALIFRDMLFDGIGDPPEVDDETPSLLPAKDEAAKIARANAVFFNVGSGDTQRRLVESVANVVLSKRPELLAEVKALLNTSRKLAKQRHAIIHAYYDTRIKFDGRFIEVSPYQVDDFGGARTKPTFSYEEAITNFSRHAAQVKDAWLRLYEATYDDTVRKLSTDGPKEGTN